MHNESRRPDVTPPGHAVGVAEKRRWSLCEECGKLELVGHLVVVVVGDFTGEWAERWCARCVNASGLRMPVTK